LKPEICSRKNRSAIPRNRGHECPRYSERPYFVSTLGLEPEPFLLITGTFNLFVKDRSAFRLSGALSVQNRSRTDANLSVLETCLNYSARRMLSTLRNHKTSTTFAQL